LQKLIDAIGRLLPLAKSGFQFFARLGFDVGRHAPSLNGAGGESKSLEPDRDQIEIFVDALFRHAGAEGFVSLRAFFEAVAAELAQPLTDLARACRKSSGVERLGHLASRRETLAPVSRQAEKHDGVERQ